MKRFIVPILLILITHVLSGQQQALVSAAEFTDSAYAQLQYGNNEKALELTRKTFELINKDNIVQDSNFLRTIENIALINYKAMQIDTAIYYQKKYLGKYRELFSSRSPRLADYITMLAIFYEANGQLAEAEPFYREALSMNRIIYKADNSKLANSIGSLAFFLDSKGDYVSANPLYKESLDMYRRLYKSAHPSLAIAIGNYAVFLLARGSFNEAEKLFVECLEMNRQLHKADHPDLANAIGNLAYYYDEMSNFSKAEILYKEALEMTRRLYKTDNPVLATNINNLAMFLDSRGSADEAEALFKEAYSMRMRLYKNDHPELASIILNMASFYEKRNLSREADSLYKMALAMYRRLYPGDHPYLANCINSYGYFLKSAGRLDEAETLYYEALAMRRRIFKTDHQDMIQSLNNMAIYLDMRGRKTEAEEYLREALDMARRMFKPGSQYLVNIIFNTASFLDKMSRNKEAGLLYKEALENYRIILDNYFIYLSDKEKKTLWDNMNIRFEVFNSYAASVKDLFPGYLADMYNNQLITKSMLFNSTNKIKRRILNSGNSVLIKDYQKLKDYREYLIKLYSYPKSRLEYEKINIDSIEKTANQLEKNINLKSEVFTLSSENQNISWKDIRNALKPGEAAIEVVRFRSDNKVKLSDTIIYAFLIVTETTKEQPEIILINEGKLLEAEYYNYYRTSMKLKRNDIRSFSRFWGQLYERIKDYKTVYFSADGIFNKLNPSTLLMPDGRYLLDVQDIRYLNSTRDLLKHDTKTRRSKEQKNAVLIGNPDFDFVVNIHTDKNIPAEEEIPETSLPSVSFAKLNDLPGAETEVNGIGEFLRTKKWKVQSLTGALALKSSLLKIKGPRVLHLATHGFFLEDISKNNDRTFGMTTEKVTGNPLLRSGLFFAGANNLLKSDSVLPGSSDNGLLTAYEAMDLDLDGTELVVLSACETGLGEIMNGEGIYGLRRAFQQAGAGSVVMSLWTVNDQGTQELMTSFYKNWIDGMTKHEALVQAQKTLKSIYPHPCYWGAFVMVGE